MVNAIENRALDEPVNLDVFFGHIELSKTERMEGNKVIVKWTTKQVARDGAIVSVKEDEYVLFEFPEVRKSLFERIFDFFV